VLTVALTALTAAMTPLTLYFTQRVIDTVGFGAAGSREFYTFTALLLLSLFFHAEIGGFLTGNLDILIRRALNKGMSAALAARFRSIDYACFENPELHDTLEAMTDDPYDKVLDVFKTTMSALQTFVSIAGVAVIFFQAGWWAVALFAPIFLLICVLYYKALDLWYDTYIEMTAEERKLRYLGKMLSEKSSLFELKLFRSIGYITGKYERSSLHVADVRKRNIAGYTRHLLLSALVFEAWRVSFVLLLALRVTQGAVTLGVFTALITSAWTLHELCFTFPVNIQELRRQGRVLEAHDRFLNLPERETAGVAPAAPPTEISVENVRFTYPGAKRSVLDGVSFTLRAGERLALVGENGAGKSTLIKLLLRLYRPESGVIRVDGVDLQTLSESAVRSIFGVVFQDFGKYMLTLRENVAFGDVSRIDDDDALREALRLGMAGGIAPLDAALGKLEENGVDLSGGEWQRIAIARACMSDAPFVILDEPTASLDPVAESALYESFSNVLGERGCVLISHRLASARLADRILLLADGKIAEEGSHEALTEAGGLYAAMYRAQSVWYRDAEQAGSRTERQTKGSESP
jgi:ABC-type multidrug transport system fused ATPase/permease subunit